MTTNPHILNYLLSQVFFKQYTIPIAVKKITHPSNTIATETQQISYNSFNKVSSKSETVTKEDITTHLIYISGGEGLCGIYVKQTQGNTIFKEVMYYVHPDHLGSFTLITDALGNVIQKCTFDAWGKREFITKDPTLNDAPESYGSFPTLYLYNGKGEIVGGGGGFHQFNKI